MASQVASIKWIPGTNFMVDGFRFAPDPLKSPHVKHFLTHFHSDHYCGLSRRFKGTVYASEVTADLLVSDHCLHTGPDGCNLVPLVTGQRVVIDGVGVTPLDANHCPGAVMLLFEVPRQGGGVHVILHTGDFRWQNWMAESGPLASIQVDTLILDTTYCNPRFRLPPQADAIAAMAAAAREELAREPSTLLVSSSYHIGKERAIFGTAEALGVKVWCSARKARTLRLLRLPDRWLSLLTRDPLEAGLHILGGGLRPERILQRYGLPVPEARSAWRDGSRAGGGRASGAAAAAGASADGEGDGEEDGVGDGTFGDEDVGGEGDAEDEEEARAAGVSWAGRWKQVVGFRPTGWAFRKKGGLSCWRLGAAAVYGVPYSEHSSYTDLEDCVKRLRPKRIIPTVNAPDAAASAAIVERFVRWCDNRHDKRRLDAYFPRLSGPPLSSGGSAGAGAGRIESAEKPAAAADRILQAKQPSPWPTELGNWTNSSSSGGSPPGGGSRGGGGGPAFAPPLSSSGSARAPPPVPPLSSSATSLAASNKQQQQAEEDVCLEDVDAEEQRRLMEEFERQQRLRKSVMERDAAKAAKRQKRGGRPSVS